jgi:hypothetical protein
MHTSLQKVKDWKLKISHFVISRGTTVKIQRTITKFEVDLRIPMKYLHMQFEFKVVRGVDYTN